MIRSICLVVLIWFGKGDGSTTTASQGNSSTGIMTTTLPSTTSCVMEAVSSEWKKEDFPNPQVDIRKCGMECNQSWICDPNQVISDKSYLSKIEAVLSRIRSNGRCGCWNCTGSGYKMSVALVNKMKFQSWENGFSQEKKALEFASYLRSSAWRLNGTCADDVVIFVSKEDGQVQTSTGPRAVSALDNDSIENVYKSVKSDLSAGYFGKAVYSMVKQYEQAILKRRYYMSNDEDEDTGISTGLIVGLVVGGVGFVFLFLICFFVCSNTGSSGIGSSGGGRGYWGGYGGGGDGGGDGGGCGGGDGGGCGGGGGDGGGC